MRIGGPGPGASANGLVPTGTGRAEQARREQVEPIEAGAGSRPGFAAAFATTRHPYVRVETAVHVYDGRPAATVEASLPPSPPQGPFLAQYIAQERLGRGLTLSQSENGASAYRRAGRPLVAIRSGATVDTAA